MTDFSAPAAAPLIQPIRLAGRASRLARAQTAEIAEALAPLASTTIDITTRGDEVLDRPLAEIGGKGLFVKALEAALLDGRADAAIHSAKDMESECAPGTMIAAYTSRRDRRDALISQKAATLSDLPAGAIVGTASVRRRAIILGQRPDIEVRLLRGNVTTRMEHLKAGKYDAIILAMAGLERLGLVDETVHALAENDFLPAAGQGALAIQTPVPDDSRARIIVAAMGQIDHAPTAIELAAERAVLFHLDGDCHTPISASAHYNDGELSLAAALYAPDGGNAVTAAAAITAAGIEKAGELGRRIAEELREKANGKIKLPDPKP